MKSSSATGEFQLLKPPSARKAGPWPAPWSAIRPGNSSGATGGKKTEGKKNVCKSSFPPLLPGDVRVSSAWLYLNNCRRRSLCRRLKEEYGVVSNQVNSIFVEYRRLKPAGKSGVFKGREFYPRGLFALEIHVQETWLRKLPLGLFEDFDLAQVAAVLAALNMFRGKCPGGAGGTPGPA